MGPKDVYFDHRIMACGCDKCGFEGDLEVEYALDSDGMSWEWVCPTCKEEWSDSISLSDLYFEDNYGEE